MASETKIPKKLPLAQMFNMLNEQMRNASNVYFDHGFGVTVNQCDFFAPTLAGNGPFLLEDYRFGLLKKGKFRTSINLKEHTIEAGMIVFITPGTIVEPISVEETELDGVGLQPEHLRLALHDRLPEMLNGHTKDGILTVTDTQSMLLDRLFHALSLLVKVNPNNQAAHLSMVATIIHTFDNLFSQNKAMAGKPATAAQTIFDRFIELVNQHCREQHQLSYYAERMCITERYLGTAVRQTSGVTAKEWIDKAIVTTAKVMLRHSNMQVVQVSEKLNFPTPSFFCKYFKRLTGLTPQEYRSHRQTP